MLFKKFVRNGNVFIFSYTIDNDKLCIYEIKRFISVFTIEDLIKTNFTREKPKYLNCLITELLENNSNYNNKYDNEIFKLNINEKIYGCENDIVKDLRQRIIEIDMDEHEDKLFLVYNELVYVYKQEEYINLTDVIKLIKKINKREIIIYKLEIDHDNTLIQKRNSKTKIPNYITELKLGCIDNFNILNNLPNELEILDIEIKNKSISNKFKKLPNNLNTLILRIEYNCKNVKEFKFFNNLPNTLKNIEIYISERYTCHKNIFDYYNLIKNKIYKLDSLIINDYIIDINKIIQSNQKTILTDLLDYN